MIKYDTYVCNICNKAQDVLVNPTGVSALLHCNITNNCAGILSLVSKLFVADEQYHTNMSVGSWVKHPLIYDHVQESYRRTWTINHNLGASVTISVLVHDVHGDLLPMYDFIITKSDNQSTTIVFDTNYTGVALCSTRQAASTVISVVVPSVEVTPLTVNNTMVLASRLGNITSIELSVQPNPLRPSDIIPLNVTANPISQTPWIGASYVVISNQRYLLSYVDITDVLKHHRAATTFFINLVNGQQPNIGDTFVLLSNAPYQHSSDRNPDVAVDVSSLNASGQAHTVLSQDSLSCTPAVLSAIYPTMKVV